MEPNVPPKIRTGIAILAPFGALARDFADLFARPLALIGGILGTVTFCGSITAMFILGSLDAHAEDEDLLDIEFMPGEIARLGDKPEEKDIPEKIIVDEKRAADSEPEETLTKEDKKPPERPKKKEEPEKKKKEIRPKSNKDKGKVSDKDSAGNNKFDDLETLDELPGNPFGSADGWSELNRAGDPWATGVMAALNSMKVPAWAAKAGASGAFKFRIKICKDGRIDQVMRKGSSGDAGLDDAISQELMRLKIPKPPANVAKVMNQPCMTMKYNFSWSAGRVK